MYQYQVKYQLSAPMKVVVVTINNSNLLSRIIDLEGIRLVTMGIQGIIEILFNVVIISLIFENNVTMEIIITEMDATLYVK